MPFKEKNGCALARSLLYQGTSKQPKEASSKDFIKEEVSKTDTPSMQARGLKAASIQ